MEQRKGLSTILIVLLLLAALIGGGFLAKTIFNNNNDSNTSLNSKNSSQLNLKPDVPTILTEDQIYDLANRSTLYWAGPKEDVKYEVTITTRGGTFIRYLPKDEPAGTDNKYLSVATYDSIDGYNGLAQAKKEDAASVTKAKSGALIVVFKSNPQSTYFSYPNAAFQIETFSPNEGESQQMVEAGDIKLIKKAESENQ